MPTLIDISKIQTDQQTNGTRFKNISSSNLKINGANYDMPVQNDTRSRMVGLAEKLSLIVAPFRPNSCKKAKFATNKLAENKKIHEKISKLSIASKRNRVLSNPIFQKIIITSTNDVADEIDVSGIMTEEIKYMGEVSIDQTLKHPQYDDIDVRFQTPRFGKSLGYLRTITDPPASPYDFSIYQFQFYEPFNEYTYQNHCFSIDVTTAEIKILSYDCDGWGPYISFFVETIENANNTSIFARQHFT